VGSANIWTRYSSSAGQAGFAIQVGEKFNQSRADGADVLKLWTVADLGDRRSSSTASL
jgi:hypothetical protein